MDAQTIFTLVPWVVLIPVIGILVNWLIGGRLGEKGIGAIASLAALGSFIIAVLLAVGLAQQPEGANVVVARWMAIGDLDVNWAFRVDTLSVTMMLVVAGVSTLIHIYSIGYMHADVRHLGHPARFRRFFLYLNLFVAAMMILVSADNYLVMFVGWEGVGLCSYLLIGFWFERGAGGFGNAQAAKKAFVVNRIGDLGFLIAMFLMFWGFRTLTFEGVFAAAQGVSQGLILAITLFLLLAVTGKSAQLPLFVWLPDAMAGPTPVSALIHAATMVTAGVYLIARSQPLFASVELAQGIVTGVGAATALLAATIALGQFDIKRVLAYSTISQLGFMVAAVGMGATVAGMFHLTTHAFFKALLFLGAGSVILGLERGHERVEESAGHAHGEHADHTTPAFDAQDMRNMGGLRRKMPLTFWVYMIGALALAGIPPLSGFFSKDEILASALEANPVVFYVLLVAAFFTAFYVGRQLLMVFFGLARTEPAAQADESPGLIVVPLAILALLAFFGGGLNFPGNLALEHWLEHSVLIGVHGAFALPTAALATGVALAGLALAWLVYGRKPLARPEDSDPAARGLGVLFAGMNRAWLIDTAYQTLIVRPYRRLATFLASLIDQSLIDGIVNGFGYLARGLAGVGSAIEDGFVRSYALIFLTGVVAIFAYLLLR